MADSTLSEAPGKPRIAVAGAQLTIRDLVLKVRVGVPEAERAAPQRLKIDILLTVEPLEPLADSLEEVADYGAVIERIHGLQGRSAQLLETWAGWIAECCLVDSRVLTADITLEKPDLLPDGTRVGTCRTYRRQEHS